MGGSKTAETGRSGVYGTLGSPASGNLPSFRTNATIWNDKTGNIWLFGGSNWDSGFPDRVLNDLWKFNPSTNEWTWMGGASTASPTSDCAGGFSGLYGTLGKPAAGNFPGARWGATSWTDSSGNLWMFGGFGCDSGSAPALLNDLWEFNPSTNQWAWMGGPDTIPPGEFYNLYPGIPGDYGVLGFADPTNQPGSRTNGTGWTDESGNLWLYGGAGLDTYGLYGGLTDVWEYDPVSHQWVWMDGARALPTDFSHMLDGVGFCREATYRQIGIPNGRSMPGCDSIETWAERNGDLWLFGGGGDGIWTYYPPSAEWAWWSGGNKSNWPGVYGTLGVASSGNIPGSRYEPSGFTDSGGNLWLFGGFAIDANLVQGYLNDLWEYLPPPRPVLPAATPLFNPPAGIYWTKQTVSIGDATRNARIYYTLDGTIPTTSSTEFTQPVEVSQGLQIQAVASANGYSDSAIGSALYTLLLPLPTFTPPQGGPTPSGTYDPPLLVSINESTPGATIYFTRDGSTPTTLSEVYTSPISVTTNTFLNAFATEKGFEHSSVASASYLPDSLMPLFIPPPGTYVPPVTVYIDNLIGQGTIYYTTDGTTPSTSSTVYTGPFNVSTTTTIKAIAVLNQKVSPVATVVYKIGAPVQAIRIPETATVAVGAHTTLVATIMPADAINPTVYWSSCDPDIVTVDNFSGVLTGVSMGTSCVSAHIPDGSVHSNACTVTVGPPFILGTANAVASRAFVKAGDAATFPLALTPAPGTTLSLPVTFSAAGLPLGSTASFTPSKVPAGAGVTDFTLTVQTAKTAAQVNRGSGPAAILICAMFLPLALLRLGKRMRRKVFRYSALALSLSLILGGTLALNGCSGAKEVKNPPVSSTITVTASNGMEHATLQVTLVIE